MLAGFLFCTASIGAVPQELNRVLIANETGSDIISIRYAPASPLDPARELGPNILQAGRGIPHGDLISFFIHYPATCELFNMEFLDSRGFLYRLEELELCNMEAGVIVVDVSLRKSVQTEGQGIPVEIQNDTQESIAFLFFSPQSFDMWGFDFLGDRAFLGPGESIVIRVIEGAYRDFDFFALAESSRRFVGRARVEEPSLIRLSAFAQP